MVIRYGFKRSVSKVINLTANNLSLTNINNLPDIIHLTVPNHSEVFVYTYKNPKRSVDEDPFAEKATFDAEM